MDYWGRAVALLESERQWIQLTTYACMQLMRHGLAASFVELARSSGALEAYGGLLDAVARLDEPTQILDLIWGGTAPRELRRQVARARAHLCAPLASLPIEGLTRAHEDYDDYAAAVEQALRGLRGLVVLVARDRTAVDRYCLALASTRFEVIRVDGDDELARETARATATRVAARGVPPGLILERTSIGAAPGILDVVLAFHSEDVVVVISEKLVGEASWPRGCKMLTARVSGHAALRERGAVYACELGGTLAPLLLRYDLFCS